MAGARINTEAKFLLLRYAFEGVLRSWSQSWAPGEEGRLRDSAMFSVIAAEWPAVGAALKAKLGPFRS